VAGFCAAQWPDFIPPLTTLMKNACLPMNYAAFATFHE
jgi:hypothetical protein